MPATFECSQQDTDHIAEIARRYHAIYSTLDLSEIIMDLTACHCNGAPLKLRLLRGAADNWLVHDVTGIRRHMDRETGELRGGFRPRSAK